MPIGANKAALERNLTNSINELRKGGSFQSFPALRAAFSDEQTLVQYTIWNSRRFGIMEEERRAKSEGESTEGINSCRGWMDVKGGGGKAPKKGIWHRSGVLTLSEAIAEYFQTKMVNGAGSHFWKMRRGMENGEETLDKIGVVGAYAVLSWGIQCVGPPSKRFDPEVGIEDVECALLLRQPRLRWKGLLPDTHQKPFEKILNIFSLTIASDLMRLNPPPGELERVEELDRSVRRYLGVDFQCTTTGELVDFSPVGTTEIDETRTLVAVPLPHLHPCAEFSNFEWQVKSWEECDEKMRELPEEMRQYWLVREKPIPGLSLREELGIVGGQFASHYRGALPEELQLLFSRPLSEKVDLLRQIDDRITQFFNREDLPMSFLRSQRAVVQEEL